MQLICLMCLYGGFLYENGYIIIIIILACYEICCNLLTTAAVAHVVF